MLPLLIVVAASLGLGWLIWGRRGHRFRIIEGVQKNVDIKIEPNERGAYPVGEPREGDAAAWLTLFKQSEFDNYARTAYTRIFVTKDDATTENSGNPIFQIHKIMTIYRGSVASVFYEDTSWLELKPSGETVFRKSVVKPKTKAIQSVYVHADSFPAELTPGQEVDLKRVTDEGTEFWLKIKYGKVVTVNVPCGKIMGLEYKVKMDMPDGGVLTEEGVYCPLLNFSPQYTVFTLISDRAMLQRFKLISYTRGPE